MSETPKWGTRVRWAQPNQLLRGEGTVTGPPLGSLKMPEGVAGIYVLWDALREPMAVFT